MLPFVRHWKTVAISALALLLVFQAAGWFLACGILQFQAKKVACIALNLPDTPLKTVTLPVNLIQKIRVGKKEIRFGGNLYDIKNQTIRGDSVTLTLYHDRHEQAVMDALGGFFGSHLATHLLPLQNWLAHWLGSTFLPPLSLELNWTQFEDFIHCFSCPFHAAQHAPRCFSPPPEITTMRVYHKSLRVIYVNL